MSILRDIVELKNVKEIASFLVISVILLLSPLLILLAIYYPELIIKLDVFKLLLLAIIAGTISIIPTAVAFLYVNSTLEKKVGDNNDTSIVLAASLFGSVIIVVPLQIILLAFAYFTFITIKLFMVLYLISTILIPFFVMITVFLERRKKAKNSKQ